MQKCDEIAPFNGKKWKEEITLQQFWHFTFEPTAELIVHGKQTGFLQLIVPIISSRYRTDILYSSPVRSGIQLGHSKPSY